MHIKYLLCKDQLIPFTPSLPPGVDANHDGHVSRSEAKNANFTVSGTDSNNDGRVTRSEARAFAKANKEAYKHSAL